MLQLSGLDTAFLNMETNTTFGHVATLMLFDGAGFRDSNPYAAIRSHFQSCARRLPPLYRRLVEVPFGLDRPYWIDEGEVDIDFHVRHIGVPPPGNTAQLAELIAHLVERPLDRNRPLWDLHVIEGLESNEIALLFKTHHAAADGASSMVMFSDIFSSSRDPVPPAAAAQRTVEDMPEAWELLARAYGSMLRHPLRGLGMQMRALRTVLGSGVGGQSAGSVDARLSRWLSGAAIDNLANAVMVAPRTPFNATVSSHRRVAFTPVALERLKNIKQAAESTLNDVVMSVCAGALRRYLLRKGALPEQPLIAMVPVSVRTGEEEELYSNHVSSILSELATDTPDPRARLNRIRSSMQNAKEIHNAIPASLLQDFSKFAAPAVAAQAARTVARLRLADQVAPISNVVISNVPGSRETLYLAGAELTALVPVSTVSDGMGLNMTVISYRERVVFGYVACRDLVPDLWDLIDDTRAAVDELAEAYRV